MKVVYTLTRKDQLVFLRQYALQYKLWRKLFVVLLITFFSSTANKSDQSIEWPAMVNHAIIGLGISLALFFLIPYLLGLFFMVGRKKPQISEQTMVLSENGISVTGPGGTSDYLWPAVKNPIWIGDYLYIVLAGPRSILVPLRYFDSEVTAINFLGALQSHRVYNRPPRGATVAADKASKVRSLSYLGILGLVPYVGGIAGIFLLIKSATLRSLRLALIGIAGIVFTIIFWSWFAHFAAHIKVFKEPYKDLAKMELIKAVHDIEFYKSAYGHYPESLDALSFDDPQAGLWDPMANNSASNSGSGQFQYEKIGDKYTLFSVGMDGKPHTADDIYPDIPTGAKVGWVKSF